MTVYPDFPELKLFRGRKFEIPIFCKLYNILLTSFESFFLMNKGEDVIIPSTVRTTCFFNHKLVQLYFFREILEEKKM